MSKFSLPFQVVFVLGGPGSGKGMQWELLCEDPGFYHLSSGDILREEIAKPGSKYRSIIKDNMEHGRVGPKEITVELLIAAMKEASTGCQNATFLIDGFPRKLDQAKLFEAELLAPSALVLLECPEDVLRQRLAERAQKIGRFDDNEETIAERIATFQSCTKEVIDHYKAQGKVVKLDAAESIEKVLFLFKFCIQRMTFDHANG